jgi:hypothetical protein
MAKQQQTNEYHFKMSSKSASWPNSSKQKMGIILRLVPKDPCFCTELSSNQVKIGNIQGTYPPNT